MANLEVSIIRRELTHFFTFFRYDIKFLCELDGIVLNIGSAYRATRNAFEFKISQIIFSTSTLIDYHAEKGLRFVSFTKDRQTTDISNVMKIEQEHKSIMRKVKRADSAVDYSEFSSGFDLHLEFVISSQYLNTTHATTDTFIEPFPTFIKAKYDPVRGSDEIEDEEASTDGKYSQFTLSFFLSAHLHNYVYV